MRCKDTLYTIVLIFTFVIKWIYDPLFVVPIEHCREAPRDRDEFLFLYLPNVYLITVQKFMYHQIFYFFFFFFKCTMENISNNMRQQSIKKKDRYWSNADG